MSRSVEQQIALLREATRITRDGYDYGGAMTAPVVAAVFAALHAEAMNENERALRAAVLRYARHDRECQYPDHDCSCGLAPIITPLIGGATQECAGQLPPDYADYRLSQEISGRATRALMESLRVCCGQPDTCERDCPLDGTA